MRVKTVKIFILPYNVIRYILFHSLKVSRIRKRQSFLTGNRLKTCRRKFSESAYANYACSTGREPMLICRFPRETAWKSLMETAWGNIVSESTTGGEFAL